MEYFIKKLFYYYLSHVYSFSSQPWSGPPDYKPAPPPKRLCRNYFFVIPYSIRRINSSEARHGIHYYQ